MCYLTGLKYYVVTLILTVSFAVFFTINQPGGTASSIDIEPFDADLIPALDAKFEKERKAKEEQKRKIEKLMSEVRRVGTVNSIVINKRDTIIAERYFDWMSAEKATNIKSASKSILSLLVGIAIEEGFLESVHQNLGFFFADYFRENPDSAKAAITIKDLLTMRSGLRTTSFDHYQDWVASDNWSWYTLDRPIVEERGSKMVYSTGTSHLLSVILTKATGMSTKDFVNKYLFDPMDIDFTNWIKDPQGYYLGGNDMALTPEDMIKIGKLVMNKGMYNGKQLVPEQWIEESLTTYTRSTASNYDYGYMWWNKEVGEYEVNFAWGYGGQYILMFPELEAVVAVTSDLEKHSGSRKYQKEMFTFIERSLIPFLEDEPKINSNSFMHLTATK